MPKLKTNVVEGELHQNITETENRTWTDTGRSFFLETIYGGACGRFIIRAGTFIVNPKHKGHYVGEVPHTIRCFKKLNTYDVRTPFWFGGQFQQSPCFECLVKYVELVHGITLESALKTKKMTRVLRRLKSKRWDSHVREPKSLLDVFEKQSLKELNRLAGDGREDILPFEM